MILYGVSNDFSALHFHWVENLRVIDIDSNYIDINHNKGIDDL